MLPVDRVSEHRTFSENRTKIFIYVNLFLKKRHHHLIITMEEISSDDKYSKEGVSLTTWDVVAVVLYFVTILSVGISVSISLPHSLIRGVLIQSCSAGAKNFTKCVFYHVQFSGVIQNIAYHCAIFTLFVYVDYYQNNQFY